MTTSKNTRNLFPRTPAPDAPNSANAGSAHSSVPRVFAALIVALLAAAGLVFPSSKTGTPPASAQTGTNNDPRLVGGTPWNGVSVAPNPAMPQKCGLTIAMVFDLSNSIGDSGLRGTKQAGLEVVNALAGTPTTIGLYNFGTEAPVPTSRDRPSLDLRNPNQVSTARATINGYQYGNQTGQDEGGTNWEGALRNVNNSGVKYDVVYFVTDGIPTTNNNRIPQNVDGLNWEGYTGDPGRIAHNYDIVAAIRQANILKNAGTRIETWAVGNFNRPVTVLKDDVRYTGPSSNRHWGPYVHVPPRTFTLNPPANFRYWARINENNYWQLSYADGTDHARGLGTIAKEQQGSTDYWYRVEDEVGAVPTGYETPVLYGYGFDNNEARVTWDPVQLYRTSRPNGLNIMRSISGRGASDLHTINNYSALASGLKKAATESCEGTLTIQKQIVDQDGKILNPTAQGWGFTSVVQGQLNQAIVEGGVQNRGTTGADGKITYKFTTAEPHKNGTATVTEIQKDNFTLRPQNGQNATCTTVDIDQGGVITTAYRNAGENGFQVGIGTGRAVYCVVQNVQSSFHVSKTPHPDQDKVTEGVQPQAPVTAEGKVTAYYDVAVTNNRSNPAGQPAGGDRLAVPVRDRVTFPEGMTVESVRFFFGDRDVTAQVEEANGTYEIPPEIFGGFAPGEKKTVEVRVTAAVDANTQTAIADGTYEKCESATPPNADNPRSMFNAVALEGEVQGEDPTRDNQACVDPVLQHVAFTVHKVDANDHNVPLEGAEFTLFAGAGQGLGVPEGGIALLADEDIPGRLVLPEGAALRPGKYELRETKAPVKDGLKYSLLPQPIEFELKHSGGKTEVVLENNPWFAGVDDADVSIIKVFNVHSGELPKTGGFGVWWIAGLGVLLAGAGLALGRGRE